MPSFYRRVQPNQLAVTGVQHRRIVRLSCRRFQEFEPAPQAGSKVWCKGCGDWCQVQELIEAWAVRCEGCRYGRFFGLMVRDAGQALGRHKGSYPNHSVVLFRNGKLVRRLDNAGAEVLPGLGLPGLDNDGTEIPF